MERIDYTAMRKSKRIQVCPNCGRKGEVSGITNKNGHLAIYAHIADVELGYLPMRIVHTRDYCVIQPDGSGKNINKEQA